VLEARGLPPLVLQDLSSGAWRRAHAAAEVYPEGPELTRRGFMRNLFAAAAAPAPKAAPEPWCAPGLRLPKTPSTRTTFHAPILDEGRCSGCDACVRLCLHGAITLAEDTAAYLLYPDACTGCDLCVDVCDRDAVRVDRFASVTDLRIPLHGGRCRSCGAVFHRPIVGAADWRLCPVCAQADHRRRLFQVL
jgi:Pyruvate/2-oxoacid:ferredoxin oxidoreductase delta subunit